MHSSGLIPPVTAALPGSYSPATTNRFFRVRLVTH